MIGKKPALGRGLSALLPGKDDVPRGTQREAEIGQLKPSRFQPRRDFSEVALADLARSIREQGIVQPIVVVARGDDSCCSMAKLLLFQLRGTLRR